MAKQAILLETGTNEVEVAEFILGGQSFGVNVAKIREFIPRDGITISHLPGRHASVDGVFLLRGKSIPLVDLAKHLGLPASDDSIRPVVVITEFNNMTTAFVAEHINRIHRVSWTDFKPLSRLVSMTSPNVVGSIHLDEREVLVLDLEHIVGQVFPESIINYSDEALAERQAQGVGADAKVIFAEDSAIIRQQVSKILKKVGYENLTVFDNGQSALDHIRGLKEQADAEGVDIHTYLDLVLTDIEMPRMDGLALCRNVKQVLGLDVPVVIFSSLINEQMARKCESVGADAFTSKPDTEGLIRIIDENTGRKTG